MLRFIIQLENKQQLIALIKYWASKSIAMSLR